MAPLRDRLASQTCQPVAANPNEVMLFHSNSHAAMTGKQTASTILLPFSGKLKVDKKLKLSHDDYKQSIEQFYANKQLSATDQLKATPPFPTPHVFAQFASMAYCDCKHGEPTPPDGWQLLTTASHFGIKNGYFGTAYWHSDHQQVVIAHRGTKNVGAVVTDFKGVVFNNYVNQMSSASTFANNIVTVLQEIEQEKKVSFELFFTGHSLGGWLAQITTFTTEYLEVKRGIFLKKLKKEQVKTLASSTVQGTLDVTQSYHPHTVVFESPGCKDMLLQMADKLDVRLNGRSIDLQQLDITSFLSAPNRINTCNSHLGTVYRIFTDLSDMGFFGKHTPLYNLATHSMDKIKQAFDPETGQVHKDDRGRLKLLEVVDWPVSAGLTGGEELNDFFKWAEHLNNYHPEVKDVSHDKVLKGHHLLRYQTKTYNECTNSLNIFNQDQWEFLELYHLLCRVKEFFKPEDLFSVMNNAEAQKEAQRKLQYFELDNKSFRCPDASTLQTFIPYVKRLVRLFPIIKESVKDKLSPIQIRNRVYQYETQLSVTKIMKNAIYFNPGNLGIREFLTGDQKIWQLQMADGDAWRGMTMVYRVLHNTTCTPSYSSEDHYTIVELERLLTVNRIINLNPLLSSIETPHLLMIVCKTTQAVNDEIRDTFKELFRILKQKNTMKIILTTQSESDIAAFIEEIATETIGGGFITTHEQFSWSDLTARSQREILEKKVIFQGRRVALNQLTSAELMTGSFPLADLLQEKELRIGEEPVLSASSGYNEKYYIDRTFYHNIVIRQDILSDKRKEKSDKEEMDDVLASTEQEFKQLSQNNPKKNVHWLEKDKSGELVWQQSQGNLKILREYVDAQKSHSYAPSDLDRLLQQAKHKRIMLIADKAGMGKSIILTHLAKQIKQTFPSHWLVRIDLNDCTEIFKAQKGKKMDKVWVLEFISRKVLKLESSFEKELFKKSFEGNEVNKVVVMVDGFDEISPSYKETVIDMLQVLKQASLEQLWVTTRPHLREELEDNLQQVSYTLQPFSEVEQVEFLKKFWPENLNLAGTKQHRLQIYATALISKLAQSISDKDKEFTGIPLQTRMLAEAFEEDFASFYLSQKSEPELPHKLDLLGLYRRFVDGKYDIYYEEKCKTPAGNVAVEGLRQNFFEQLQEEHERLALEVLFTEDQVTFLRNDHHSTFSDEDLGRIGIAYRNNEGKPHFIHRTFAEYSVAEFLIKHLTKETKSTQVQNFLLHEILLRVDFKVIRAFLNGLLEKYTPTEEVLKQCAELLYEQWNETEVNGILVGFETALHTAAEEDNANIIGFILDCLKSGEHLNVPTKMLLAKNYREQNVWHMAAMNDSVQALKKIWKWGELLEKNFVLCKREQLNAKEFKNNLLLTKDEWGSTAWHLAAETGTVEVMETIRSFVKEAQINTHELLLDKNRKGENVCQVAVENNNLKLLEKIWEWCKEAQLEPNELMNKLILAKDHCGYTAWHRAAKNGSLGALETLWSWATEAELNPHELLLAQSGKGYTAWLVAAKNMQLILLMKMWDWAKEVKLNPALLKDKFLLAQDKNGHTAWHRAAERGSLETFEALWKWAKEVEVNPYEMLLSKNEEGNTAWQMAVKGLNLEILKKLWIWAKEAQVNLNELQNKFLLAKDKYGHTAWHRAAERGSLQAFEALWGWAKEVKLNKDKLLLAQTDDKVTAFHLAAGGNHVEILQKLWVWAIETQLNSDEIKNELLLAKDKYGYTAWHRAAEGGSLETLELLLGWAKDVQIDLDYLLLFQNEEGNTAWQMATHKFHLEVLKKLWVWAKEAQMNTNQLKNNLLLSKDWYGYTAWHRAAERGSLETLELLLGWAKDVQIDLDYLFLFQNVEGNTAWQMATQKFHLEVLKKMWVWAKDMQLNPDALKNNVLLAKDQYGNTAWHRAAEIGDLVALETFWSWAKEVELNTDELLQAENTKRKTAWQIATKRGHFEILQKLWTWAKENQMKPNELKNILLLAKDEDGYTAWHQAAQKGSLQTLDTLWRWAKDVQLKPAELLLLQNKDGNTVWQVAARRVHLEVMKKLWEWAKEVGLNANELKNKLLLAKDKYGYTAWHWAARESSLQALEILWSWAEEEKLNPRDLRNKLLLTHKRRVQSLWNMVPVRKNEDVLNKLWVWAKELKLDQNDVKNNLLLATDKYGETAWHKATERGSLQALELLWSWAKDMGLSKVTMKNKLLLAKNQLGETSWNIAARISNADVLGKLWVLAKEVKLKRSELKDKLLLTKDKEGFTTWHTAALNGHLKALQTLWICAKEVGINTDEFFLAQTKDGDTALKLAVRNNNVPTLQTLLLWAEGTQLSVQEKFLLAKDKYGDTIWHQAAEESSLQALATLWCWAKEQGLNTDELLLARNNSGLTARQLITQNHLNSAEKLRVWETEVQRNSQLWKRWWNSC